MGVKISDGLKPELQTQNGLAGEGEAVGVARRLREAAPAACVRGVWVGKGDGIDRSDRIDGVDQGWTFLGALGAGLLRPSRTMGVEALAAARAARCQSTLQAERVRARVRSERRFMRARMAGGW